MDVRRTMQPRADGDVERLIEDGADLGGRQRLAAEADRTNATGRIAVAENFVAADLVEPSPQPFAQLDLVPVYRVHPTLHDVFHPGDEAGDAEHVRRAAFQKIRVLARLRLAGG